MEKQAALSPSEWQIMQYENGMILLSTGERGDATQCDRCYTIRAGELLERMMQEMNK